MSREKLPGLGSERTGKVWEARPSSQAQPASVDPVLRAVAASLQREASAGCSHQAASERREGVDES